jgi:hypothetical protein
MTRENLARKTQGVALPAFHNGLRRKTFVRLRVLIALASAGLALRVSSADPVHTLRSERLQAHSLLKTR